MAMSALPHAPGDDSGRTEVVRLAILDDHEVLLDSLGSWIGSHAPDFEVVLMAATWLQLVHSPAFPTDLVFIDFQLKEPVSIEARVRTCRAAGARVMVLSSIDTPEARDRALAAGAADFVSKALPMASVMDAARRIMGMEADAGAHRAWRPLPTGATQAKPRLSPGEEEALRLYSAGFSTAEVAERMNV
jgi:DNA-binding NarL/FixJ family response regulator